MSWLLKSLQMKDPDSSPQTQSPAPSSQEHSPSNRSGVKEDFSVIGQTIGRQLWGVAAFLAPPTLSPSSKPSITPTTTTTDSEELPSDSSSSSQTLLGIRNDLAEIGGSFKSGLSLLSSNKAVTEISKFASNLLQFQNEHEEGEGVEEDEEDEEENDGAPGITEEVIDFVKEISMRPECWTEFRLPLDNDFKMSDAQRAHVSIVEHLAPSLAALRVNLHTYMGDEKFWIIYFIFLLPRLNLYDFELLSTHKVVKTRDLLLQKLQNKRNAQLENSNNLDSPQEGSEASETQRDNIPSMEKEVTDIISTTEGLEIDHKKSADQLFEEADSDTSASADTPKKLENEDVSFSDLEDDDNDLSDKLTTCRAAQGIMASPSRSNDWVQLSESPETQNSLQKAGLSISQDKDSEGEESNDWLKVDDFD